MSAKIVMPAGVTASAIRVSVLAVHSDEFVELFSSTYPPLPAGQMAFNANVALPIFNWYGYQAGSVTVEVVGQDAEIVPDMRNSKGVNLLGNLVPPDPVEE